MLKCSAAITHVSHWVPEEKLTNKDLEQLVETTGEWILDRTGIEERRILRSPEKGSAFLATQAAQALLLKSNLDPLLIDLVIVATATPEYQYPATANIVCSNIGARNAWSFDVNGACNGFLFALNIARQFIENGTHKKVVVIGADKMSSVADYSDRKTCILFGDGAGAALLEPNFTGLGIIDALLKTSGQESELLYQKAGGSLFPATTQTVNAREHYLRMNGPEVMTHAIQCMSDVTQELLARNSISVSDIKYFIAHQANKRIIEEVVKRINLPNDVAFINIEKYGNTSTATLPICLSELEPKLQQGDTVILSSFGAGFSWGALYLKWASIKAHNSTPQ